MNIPWFLLKRLFLKYPNRRPAKQLNAHSLDVTSFLTGGSKAVWFGHSTIFLQIERKTILCDPMLHEFFCVFTLFMGKRFTKKIPLLPKDFPVIDVLLLSHDHYDHMDYQSIMELEKRVQHFCVPHGLAKRLQHWGIDMERIVELSYGDVWKDGNLTFTCTPNQHFSGRSLNDRNRTLWCSWVIAGQMQKVFFSGDGAYGPHFKQIGNMYGPFDLIFMECGQGSKRMSMIHMVPEKAVQAQLDLQGTVMLPIHWGMFSQSNKDWTAQVERLLKAAQQRGTKVTVPSIGEPVHIGADTYPTNRWWRTDTTGRPVFLK